MATGKVFLRPSADVSLEHTIYPSSLSAAYLAINDEVCDMSASYIEVANSANSSSVSASGTSQFKMGTLDTPMIIQSVLGATFIVSSDDGYEFKNYITFTLLIDGVQYSEWTEDCTQASGGFSSKRHELTNDEIEVIADYFAVNKSFPNIEIKVYSYISDDSDTSKATNMSVSQKISQMFIELECEGIPYLSKKIDGQWKGCAKVLRKISGQWSEIRLNEAHTLLSSNLFIDKCKCYGHTEKAIADIAATCTETGMTGGKYCSFCGNTVNEHDTVIPALGHNEVATAGTATCTEDGMIGGTYCSRCGVTLTEHNTVQAALGHSETALADTKATCTADGATGGIKCSRCGITLKEHDIVIPAKGHNYNVYTGQCSNGCYGYHPDSFKFTILYEGNTSVTSYYSMPNLTWGEWVNNNTLWSVKSDGSVVYRRIAYVDGKYKYVNSVIDGVVGTDLIISGQAYTSTDEA